MARLLQKYGFDDRGDEIKRRWTGQNGKRDSLRTLADVFNQRILQQAMENSGIQLLEGEVENVYELLTGDDVTNGIRTKTETRLRQQGIDVEELRGDFVT